MNKTHIGTLCATLILAVISLVSCNGSKKELAERTQRTASQLPIDCVNLGEITALDYTPDDNLVRLVISFAPDQLSATTLNADPVFAREILECALTQARTPQLDSIIALASVSDTGLEAVFTNSVNGDKASVSMTPDDLAYFLDHPTDMAKQRKLFLDNELALLNDRCPISMGDGFELASVSNEGKQVAVTFLYDDTKFEARNFTGDDACSKELAMLIAKEDFHVLIGYLVEQNKELRYIMRGKTGGKEQSVTLSVGELSWLHKTPKDKIR